MKRKLGRRYDSFWELDYVGRKNERFVTIQHLLRTIDFTDGEINKVLDLNVGESIRWPKDKVTISRVR